MCEHTADLKVQAAPSHYEEDDRPATWDASDGVDEDVIYDLLTGRIKPEADDCRAFWGGEEDDYDIAGSVLIGGEGIHYLLHADGVSLEGMSANEFLRNFGLKGLRALTSSIRESLSELSICCVCEKPLFSTTRSLCHYHQYVFDKDD